MVRKLFLLAWQPPNKNDSQLFVSELKKNLLIEALQMPTTFGCRQASSIGWGAAAIPERNSHYLNDYNINKENIEIITS